MNCLVTSRRQPREQDLVQALPDTLLLSLAQAAGQQVIPDPRSPSPAAGASRGSPSAAEDDPRKRPAVIDSLAARIALAAFHLGINGSATSHSSSLAKGFACVLPSKVNAKGLRLLGRADLHFVRRSKDSFRVDRERRC